jgi:DNA-binding MarR family transcriptional regulator
MAELLKSLAEAGFIARVPAPDNARILRTTLTATGKRAVARAGTELASVERRVTARSAERR